MPESLGRTVSLSFDVKISVLDVDTRQLSSCHLPSCRLVRGHPDYRTNLPDWESAASGPGDTVGRAGWGEDRLPSAAPSSFVGLLSGSHLSDRGDEKVR